MKLSKDSTIEAEDEPDAKVEQVPEEIGVIDRRALSGGKDGGSVERRDRLRD